MSRGVRRWTSGPRITKTAIAYALFILVAPPLRGVLVLYGIFRRPAPAKHYLSLGLSHG